DPNGAFYRCVIMDRHLGAIRAGMQTNQLDGVRTFGLLYQVAGKIRSLVLPMEQQTKQKLFITGMV
ncbi:hypothetical protein, partial [Parabacteroides distasonis]|uniref:hypothetical protein n=1 Tax=Parabacteroides distasonis TaxID=823 RepID=UPI00195F1328